ncbi:hypothetical protein B0H67DRAFT_552366 [Lasiosphaeris hirsuta]|uniref:Uncharacterized protein n=1 Tax=Lasiosphaeris hirsuta TaxID=260670 RepID=A0AA40AQH1_9PEZI|nr:hypothetical protein B0H67DRAFT_552366 [Lasiosphaeris hirsuta]
MTKIVATNRHQRSDREIADLKRQVEELKKENARLKASRPQSPRSTPHQPEKQAHTRYSTSTSASRARAAAPPGKTKGTAGTGVPGGHPVTVGGKRCRYQDGQLWSFTDAHVMPADDGGPHDEWNSVYQNLLQQKASATPYRFMKETETSSTRELATRHQFEKRILDNKAKEQASDRARNSPTWDAVPETPGPEPEPRFELESEPKSEPQPEPKTEPISNSSQSLEERSRLNDSPAKRLRSLEIDGQKAQELTLQSLRLAQESFYYVAKRFWPNLCSIYFPDGPAMVKCSYQEMKMTLYWFPIYRPAEMEKLLSGTGISPGEFTHVVSPSLLGLSKTRNAAYHPETRDVGAWDYPLNAAHKVAVFLLDEKRAFQIRALRDQLRQEVENTVAEMEEREGLALLPLDGLLP